MTIWWTGFLPLFLLLMILSYQKKEIEQAVASQIKRKKGDREMQDLGSTQHFSVQVEPETGVKVVLSSVYEALNEKGYNPVNQIVGYIMSGDPTYITSHNNARSLIMKVERDELVEELLTQYIKNNGWA